MERSVEFNKYIRPICLPEVAGIPVKRGIASGWGHTRYGGDGSNALLKVILEFFTNAECNRTYADVINRKLRQGIVDATQVCAGSRNANKDTCQVIFYWFLCIILI